MNIPTRPPSEKIQYQVKGLGCERLYHHQGIDRRVAYVAVEEALRWDDWKLRASHNSAS